MRKAKWVLIIAGVSLLVLASIFFVKSSSQKSPVPNPYKNALGFSTPYPTKLPEGFSVNPSSFNSTNSVLIYSIDTGNQPISVSVQRKPESFDFDSFYSKGLQGTQKFTTDIGEAAVGKAEGKIIGSLLAGDSWAILTSTSSTLTQIQLQEIIKNFSTD